MRLFYALPVPAELKRFLTELLAIGRSRDRSLKWVPPENLHVTLRFLGETPAVRLAALQSALREVAASQQSFRLTLGSLGAFPDLKRPRVIWIGFRGEELPINQLAASFEQAARTIGFPPETKPFRSHLTLARVGERGVNQQLRDWMLSATIDSREILFERVTLFESVLSPHGATYRVIDEAPIGGNEDRFV